MAKIVILGGGGHSRSVFELASSCAFRDIRLQNFPDKPEALELRLSPDERCVIAIADKSVRRSLANQLKRADAHFGTLISPYAIVAADAEIGNGCVVMPGAIIRCGVKIGEHTIINTGAIIDHDTVVGDFCHIAPGAVICGGTSIQHDVWVGASATILDSISIVSGAYIGAGALVNKSIYVSGTFIGVPARRNG